MVCMLMPAIVEMKERFEKMEQKMTSMEGKIDAMDKQILEMEEKILSILMENNEKLRAMEERNRS